MKSPLGFLLRHNRLFLGLLLLVLLVPASCLPSLTVDNSIEVWLLPNSQAYRHYRDFLQRYGSEEFVLVGVESGEDSSKASLAGLSAAASEIRKLPAVGEVWDPLSWRRGVEDMADWPDLAGALDRLASPFLFGADCNRFGTVIFFRELKGSETRRAAVESIRAALHAALPSDTEIHLAGAPYLNVELDRASQTTAKTFFPIVLVVSWLILYILFREAKAVLALTASVFYVLIWSMGLFAWAGTPLNMVTVILPVMVFVNAASQAIHFISRFLHLNSHPDVSHTLRETFSDLSLPVLFTCLTTAAGFGSLVFTEMKPVGDLGLHAAVGVCLALLVNMTFLPLVLSFLYPRPQPSSFAVQAYSLHRLGAAVCRNAAWIGPFSILLTGVLFWQGIHVRPQNNILNFFPSDSRIVQDYEWIGDHLSGYYTIELDVADPGADPQTLLHDLRSLGEGLSTHPLVAGVQHGAELLPALDALRALAGDTPEWQRLSSLAGRYWHSDPETHTDHYRLSIWVRTVDSDLLDRLMDDVRHRAAKHLPPSAKWHLTGVVPLLNRAQANLLSTQIQSLFYSSVSVFAMIGLLFRSVRAVWVSLIPNLLPISFTFAVMAVFRIPLDTATVMIAGIAMGIVVDDTIHLIAQYRQESLLHQDAPPALRISNAMSLVGRATVFTSLLIVTGFFSFFFADFRPLSYFGLLTAATMLVASLGDLLVLPALIQQTRLWSRS